MLSKKPRLVVLFLLAFLFLSPSLGTATASDPSTSRTTLSGPTLIYVSGRGTWFGCSEGTHFTPFWFQTKDRWVSFAFTGIIILISTSGSSISTTPVRVYMEGFKGIAPGFLLWSMKSAMFGRIRVFGVCSYVELNALTTSG